MVLPLSYVKTRQAEMLTSTPIISISLAQGMLEAPILDISRKKKRVKEEAAIQY